MKERKKSFKRKKKFQPKKNVPNISILNHLISIENLRRYRI